MKFRLLLVLGIGVLLTLTACEQPTVDPDQKYRDLLVGTTWGPDPAYSGETQPPIFLFYRNGTAQIGAGFQGTWSYEKGTLTIQRTIDGYVDVTTAPDLVISRGNLVFQYVGVLRHLVPFADQ